MSQPVTCPHCAAALRTPPLDTGITLTCPRCQGTMPHPLASNDVAPQPALAVLALDAELGVAASTRLPLVYGLRLLYLGVMLAGLLSGLLYPIADNFDAWVKVGGIGMVLCCFGVGACMVLAINNEQIPALVPDTYWDVVGLTLAAFLWLTIVGTLMVFAAVLFALGWMGGLVVVHSFR